MGVYWSNGSYWNNEEGPENLENEGFSKKYYRKPEIPYVKLALEKQSIHSGKAGLTIKALNPQTNMPRERGNLITIDEEGRVHRHHYVNQNLGFTLVPEDQKILRSTTKISNPEDKKVTFKKEKPPLIERWEWKLKSVAGGKAVCACDKETGETYPDGYLVKFKEDGTVYFYHTINPLLGLPLDEYGRMKEVNQ